MFTFLDEAQTAHEGTWYMHICTQWMWFGNAFAFHLSIRQKKVTEIQEHSWRMVLEMNVQFFYKREKQKYEIQISQGALYIRELRTCLHNQLIPPSLLCSSLLQQPDCELSKPRCCLIRGRFPPSYRDSGTHSTNLRKIITQGGGGRYRLAFHGQEQKGDLLLKKNWWVLPFSLQLSFWLRCSGKTLHIKKTWFSLPRARAQAHRAIYTGTHSAGCSRTAESRHSENIDHMIFLPPPSTPPLPPPLLTPTQVVNKLVARIRL